MRICVVLVVLMTVAMPLHAQSADTDVCIMIDEARDMLSPADRTAAISVMESRFELEGRHVSPSCGTTYTLSHIRLGQTVIVSLLGPKDRRDGTALGLDDLPALYSQMVRSMVTGRPMEGFNVVDRTNVTASQARQERVQSDRFGYARLGYGGMFGDRTYGTPAMGFGYRVELDSFAVDVSFLNFQMPGDSYESSNSAFSGSLLKLEGLRFLKPKANASAYIGGGLSWGGSDFGGNTYDYAVGGVVSGRTSWHGSGLQGEITVGYEMPRASTLRFFVQADATLPFYTAESETYSYGGKTATVRTTERQYAPSVVVSVGLGWQRNRGGRP